MEKQTMYANVCKSKQCKLTYVKANNVS